MTSVSSRPPELVDQPDPIQPVQPVQPVQPGPASPPVFGSLQAAQALDTVQTVQAVQVVATLAGPGPQRAGRTAHVARCRSVRRRIVRMCATRDGGHLGGSMSIVEILVELYGSVMNVGPHRTDDPERDFLALSKGHGAIALYSVLAEFGYLEEELVNGYGQDGGPLFAHPNEKVNGVEIATGSLGHGLPVALGVALGARIRGSGRRVFTILGDGELQEGSVWEAVMAAGSRKVSNLVAVVDRNGLQITGPTDAVIDMTPMGARWRAFGWEVREVDGHDTGGSLLAALKAPSADGAPVVVVASTVKGKGVPAVQGQARSHFATIKPSQLRRTLASLDEAPA